MGSWGRLTQRLASVQAIRPLHLTPVRTAPAATTTRPAKNTIPQFLIQNDSKAVNRAEAGGDNRRKKRPKVFKHRPITFPDLTEMLMNGGQRATSGQTVKTAVKSTMAAHEIYNQIPQKANKNTKGIIRKLPKDVNQQLEQQQQQPIRAKSLRDLPPVQDKKVNKKSAVAAAAAAATEDPQLNAKSRLNLVENKLKMLSQSEADDRRKTRRNSQDFVLAFVTPQADKRMAKRC